jgi:hypothetical protein
VSAGSRKKGRLNAWVFLLEDKSWLTLCGVVYRRPFVGRFIVVRPLPDGRFFLGMCYCNC